MAVSEADVEELIAELDRGRARWIDGKVDLLPTGPVRQATDMTVFGPFGGEGPRPGEVSPEVMLAGQAAVAAQFHGGTGRCEVVRTIVEGDLVVVVMVERSEVIFEGHDRPHPWVLRTTQVFRRNGSTWERLHRHADPLIGARPLHETLELLGGTTS